MSDTTTGSITIAASPDEIMDVIADLERYPEWVSAAKSVTVVEAGEDGRPLTARFVLDAGVVNDHYVLEYEWAADGRRVDWNLTESQLQKGQEGAYILSEVEGGTRVEYRLEIRLAIPMIGLFKRKAEKRIIDTALIELRKRVEG